MTDDERRIRRRSSFGCHVADSDVAPEMCVKEMKEGGYRGLTYCGRRQRQALSPSDDDAWSSSRRLGLVVDGGGSERTLWIVDPTQIEHRRLPTFALGVTNPQHD